MTGRTVGRSPACRWAIPESARSKLAKGFASVPSPVPSLCPFRRAVVMAAFLIAFDSIHPMRLLPGTRPPRAKRRHPAKKRYRVNAALLFLPILLHQRKQSSCQDREGSRMRTERRLEKLRRPRAIERRPAERLRQGPARDQSRTRSPALTPDRPPPGRPEHRQGPPEPRPARSGPTCAAALAMTWDAPARGRGAVPSARTPHGGAAPRSGADPRRRLP
jgi:hypothetical protein